MTQQQPTMADLFERIGDSAMRPVEDDDNDDD